METYDWHNGRRRANVILIGIALLALLLWATVANAQERPRKAFAATNIALASLAAVDVWQSAPCLSSTRCKEINPLYKRASPTGMAVIKAAGMGGVSLYAWKLRKRHPKLAWGLLGSLTALQGAVVIHNSRVRR